MKKGSKGHSELEKLAIEQTILARERTFLAEEMAFLGVTRMVIFLFLVCFLIFKLLIEDYFFSNFLIVLFGVFALVIIVEELHRFHKRTGRLKTLEERLS